MNISTERLEAIRYQLDVAKRLEYHRDRTWVKDSPEWLRENEAVTAQYQLILLTLAFALLEAKP